MPASSHEQVSAPDSSVTSAQERELLVFSLAGEDFALPLKEVREIMTSVPVTPVPHAPSAVLGVFNLRGKVATLVDLRTILGFAQKTAEPGEHIVIVDDGADVMGIVVGTVTGVVKIAADAVKPVSETLASRDSAHLLEATILQESVLETGKHVTKGTSSPARLILLLNLPAVLKSVSVPKAS